MIEVPERPGLGTTVGTVGEYFPALHTVKS